MDRVKGKVALVTGAAGGLGQEVAQRLASEGARVVLTDLARDAGEKTARAIGDAALFVEHDVTSEASWQSVMAAAEAKFGRLDVLVNNAAICPLGTIEEATLEQWRKTQQVNAEGYFLGCKYAIASMKKHGQGGSIVNMASMAALVGLPGWCAYTGSKGAVTALTRNVAVHCKEQKYRIRCNSIHPDGILTSMMVDTLSAAGLKESDIEAMRYENDPSTRMAYPSDIANLVLFLASEESRFINGIELRIDNARMVTGL
ncbi:MAG: SDR family oxidoreductase [Proteobacteria bacterium]|nr:SDR family oxidoreductase [Pseudomonadota bacterium]HQR03151.1 SDR family oxidoreductase [Rhodocyclaceae bacterium]